MPVTLYPNIHPTLAMSASSTADLSNFTNLLLGLDGLETISVQDDPRRIHPVGSIIDYKDSVRKVTKIYDVHADDWFVESDWRMVVVKPWAKSRQDHKIEWLEDNLIPRL